MLGKNYSNSRAMLVLAHNYLTRRYSDLWLVSVLFCFLVALF